METNAFPIYDRSVNQTGCCPRFDPDGWDRRRLRFREALFVRATTTCVQHVPVGPARIFARVRDHIADARAANVFDVIVLSRDLSPWQSEHLFPVTRPVPGEETLRLTGDFVTHAFEGPRAEARLWQDEMEDLARQRGRPPMAIYFFHTTCPACAAAYGENYIVAVAET
jgi:hypothetical protein